MNQNNFGKQSKKSGSFFKYSDRVWQGIKAINHRYQIIRWLILIFLTLFLMMSIYMTYIAKTMDVSNLHSSLKRPTIIYDDSGHQAGQFSGQKGSYVGLKEISPNLPNAIISTEDRNFYHEHGFSVRGYGRAVLLMIKNKLLHRNYISGGGSTLTQQLVKNTYLTQQQTFNRKLKELFMSIQVANVYPKNDILTMYMNNAYFGNGVYGVQDASERYFGLPASKLPVQDAAILAGMLTNPGAFNPINHPKLSKERRNVVLYLMAENHKISMSKARALAKTPINVKNNYIYRSYYQYPYYFDAVINEAINRYGISESDIMNHGYRIYTTLNQKQQSDLQNNFRNKNNFPHNARDGAKVQAASIAMNPHTGGVTAVVGGRGKPVFRGYNRATQMTRQPGSTMKPLAVYTPALESGYRYDSKLLNKPKSYDHGTYTPKNYNNVYTGHVPMYKALAQSMNAPTVWLLNRIGVDKGFKSAEKFGIPLTNRDKNLALGLGGLSKGVSPQQMASAYTAFANKGTRTSPHYIRKIVNASGKVIVNNTGSTTHNVMSPGTAKQMTSMMLGVFDDGSGVDAKPNGYQVAGKTGSTQADNTGDSDATRDKWIVGYTPDVVLATWEGFDKTDRAQHLENLSGTGIGPLFKTEMQEIIPTTKETSFNVKDAQTIADKKNSSSSNNLDDFKQKASKVTADFDQGFDSVKKSTHQLFNKAKHFLE
ncbi:transglycosylase domain-containing protein [Acetilactobacillus jinshanensis]|uniref:PBP1A family penicillin-binding protein n=1 Tax=Acetilactobacillus jinshanensis TaxID=1720083 RepID=A0A4P6ZM56_9LACO|nr:PBP1A family penicillin-binding protein [Acetilactobacillus jinshanensis]QBP18693.1 PBP1A family penicillin-binding protein [Acetilactobacillus jinshanensis]